MRIASVQDNAEDAARICAAIEGAGYQCECFTTGGAAMRALRDRTFDLLLLDWRLPDVSGLDVLQWVRLNLGSNVPVLFVTSRVLEDDAVAALSAGADDYLAKPIRERVLVARVAALLRRSSSTVSEIVQVGPYTLDLRSRSIVLRGVRQAVTPREFQLALFLFRNANKLIPNALMEKTVWGKPIGADSRTVTTHLSRLRTKLALRPENGVRLSAVYALGYRLDVVAPEGNSAPSPQC